MVKRGEVWLVALDPTVGVEIQKTRPCLVVSPPEIHDNLRIVLVSPMTSGSRPLPFRVPIRFQGIDGFVVLEQTRAVDKRRMLKRLGEAPATTLQETLATLSDLFAL
jgi:mRNA interferase MazF